MGLLLTFITFTVASALPVVAQIDCGKLKGRFDGQCTAGAERRCADQWLTVNGHQMPLDDSADASRWAQGWACVKSATRNFLIVEFGNGRNCEECENLELFDTNGKRLTPGGKNFRDTYRKMSLPKKLPKRQPIDFPGKN